MNKQELLLTITETVRSKHPWRISQKKYLAFFGEFPKEFLEERLAYDNLIEKAKQFKLCIIPFENIKIDIKLTLDELIRWELSLDKWKDAQSHNIVPNDIKKLLLKKD